MNPRVTAGKYKNMRLEIPNNTRPFTERTKLVLFDTLSHFIQGKTVLDLFCGAGSIGIEALSRGAERIVFADNDEKSVLFLRKNIENLDKDDKNNTSVYKTDYKTLYQKMAFKVDLVVADPPFNNASDLKYRPLYELLKPDGIAVVKLPTVGEMPDFEGLFDLLDTKLVGNNTLYFLRPIL